MGNAGWGTGAWGRDRWGGDVLSSGPGVGDIDPTPPVIGPFDPPDPSDIYPTDAITFQVTDNLGLLRRVAVHVELATGTTEVVHDGDVFRGLYAQKSTRTAIPGGYQYVVRRSGTGWPSTPGRKTPIKFRVYAIDDSGNEST